MLGAICISGDDLLSFVTKLLRTKCGDVLEMNCTHSSFKCHVVNSKKQFGFFFLDPQYNYNSALIAILEKIKKLAHLS